jgi:hypothetical protein
MKRAPSPSRPGRSSSSSRKGELPPRSKPKPKRRTKGMQLTQTLPPPTTPTPTNGKQQQRLPEGWQSWPTAGKVAKRLGVARAHVYRLEKRGDLRGVEGVWMGRNVMRFDPATVEALEPRGLDVAEEDEGADDETASDAAIRLLTRSLSEMKQIAIDARKGQHDAYTLVAKPSQELHTLTSDALKQAYERIRELEDRLNKMHDEQRDSRREDREFALFEKQVADGDARKDQFMQLFFENAPVVFGQLLETMKGAKGPLADWLRAKSPEQQKKYIAALETFVSVADEVGDSSSSSSPEETPKGEKPNGP